MKKFLIGAFGAVGVIFILAASIGMWILIGALLVWLASLAIVSIKFSWALAALVGIALAMIKGIFGAAAKIKTKRSRRSGTHEYF